MSQIRFYTDEDVYGAVAGALRRAGYDAVSTPEVGRLNESDESQLPFAANEGRAIVTFNVGDFAVLHTQWMQQGQHHAGIIVSDQVPIGELLKRLLRLTRVLDADDMIDRLEFLGSW